MSHEINRLTAKFVERVELKPGYYHDGGGLYLQVTNTEGKRSWVLRYMLDGKAREMGLGSLRSVTLARARAKAADCRLLVTDRIDPIEARRSGREQRALDAAKSVTFQQCAIDYIEENKAGWKNAKHRAQWTSTLTKHVYPTFGAVTVQAVDTPLVVRALKLIWTTKHETATRVRARIESILDAAKALELREGDNPARWKGHLDNLLPRIEKRKRVRHHPALPFDRLCMFMPALRGQEGVGARALEFLILTATRTEDVIGARWSEINLDTALWTIPAARIKAGREHRVPLSSQAMKLLRPPKKDCQTEYVFTGVGDDAQPLSNMAMLALLKRMDKQSVAQGEDGWRDPLDGRRVVPHGFRSTFRDWVSERTDYSRDVCEMALAHVVGDQTEAAYRSGDLFDKRRGLMAEWAKFCGAGRPTRRGAPGRKKRK